MRLATDALRQVIFNSLTAQSRNDGTSGISLESRWYAVRSNGVTNG